MKISVIIPTYNREAFILKAIESIENQTIKINEIIVVDDGSIDNTKQLLENKKNIKYIYQKNSGVSVARNVGIKNAKNDWICFLDSDDIWEKNKIEKQIEFHKMYPNILFSHTDEVWLFNDKLIKQKTYQQKLDKLGFKDNIVNTFIGASTVMIHKNIFDEVGCFDESLIACEDYDLWLRVLYKYELGFINEKLIKKIAGHSGQLSFETALMDEYRIKALLKHMDSKYKDDIKKEILKKCDILINGAIKHNNKSIQEYYINLKATF